MMYKHVKTGALAELIGTIEDGVTLKDVATGETKEVKNITLRRWWKAVEEAAEAAQEAPEEAQDAQNETETSEAEEYIPKRKRPIRKLRTSLLLFLKSSASLKTSSTC